jgi:ABC-type transport system involved in multi-copper enzyme maturation permease subunit
MMKNLKIEWLKVRNYRTFWILWLLFVICLAGVNYMVYHIQSSVKVPAANMLVGTPFSFPDVWQTVSYISSFLLFFPGLILLILITNEYNYKTHRQNIIDGISRFEFAFTKIVMVVIFAVKATLLEAIITVITGLLAGSAFSFNQSVYLFYFFLQALTYILTGLLFGFLFKKSGLAIALYFIYLFFIKNILSALVSHYIHDPLGDYFPIKSSDVLIPFPVFKSFSEHIFTPPNTTLLLVCTVAYLAIFYFIIVRKFTTEDL